MTHRSANAFAGPVARVWLALLALTCASAGVAQPDEAISSRFVPVGVYLESPEPVAAWQFELADGAGVTKVVGIEGGGHPAYPRTPYYDRDADRVVVADYSLAEEDALPRVRVRLATLHLMLEGDPDFALRLVTATTAAGRRIDASVTFIGVGDAPTEPREGSP